MDTNRKGDITELEAAVWLLKRGYEVFRTKEKGAFQPPFFCMYPFHIKKTVDMGHTIINNQTFISS